MFSFNYDLATFTPREAESITGLSTVLQRDWRRRDYIASQGGRARFDVFGLAELLFLKSMTDRGVAIRVSKPLVGLVTQGVVFQALAHDDAYAGAESPLDDRSHHASRVVTSLSPLGRKQSRVIPARFLILWADDSEVWTPSLDAAFFDSQALSTPERLAGPVIVFDQKAAGDLLRQRALRPLVFLDRIEADENAGLSPRGPGHPHERREAPDPTMDAHPSTPAETAADPKMETTAYEPT